MITAGYYISAVKKLRKGEAEMRKNIKFLTITASLILSSVLLLGCGMTVLTKAPVGGSEYASGEVWSGTSGGMIDNTPTSQSEMAKKFDAFNIVTVDEKGKNILTICSDEQYEEFETSRKNGERFFITEEELYFLVNNSAQLYFKYDEIILTRARELPSYIETVSDCIADYADTDIHITADHMTTSESQNYNNILRGIYDIIVYRVGLFDSRLLTGSLYSCMYSGRYGGFTEFGFSKRTENALTVYCEKANGLVLDGGEIAELPQYKTEMEWMCEYGTNLMKPDDKTVLRASEYTTLCFDRNLISVTSISASGGLKNVFPEAGVTYTWDEYYKSIMHGKFDIYTHITEDEAGKRTATLFTKEQADGLLAMRDAGTRIPLTCGEVKYIINDSVSLCLECDEIILTRANWYYRTLSPVTLKTYREKIKSGEGLSEAEYNDLMNTAYVTAMTRLITLDAGFLGASLISDLSEMRDNERLFFDSESSPRNIFVMIPGSDAPKDIDSYKELIGSEYVIYRQKARAVVSSDLKTAKSAAELTIKYPLVISDTRNREIYCMDDQGMTKLYPVYELTDVRKWVYSQEEFRAIVKAEMPYYDFDRASIHLPAEQYAKISEDMTFEELINTYGIPYNGYTSGFWTGRYITDKGETVTVYFGGSDKEIKIIGVILPKK